MLPLLTALIALSISNPPPDYCPPLPDLRRPLAFGPGEMLAFDLDALGARAGKMTVRVLPQKDGHLPIQAEAETNTFFSKVRRVKGTATSYLNPKSLRPARYVEDALENGIRKTAEVDFRAKDHTVKVSYKIDERAEQAQFRYANDGLDAAGAIFLIRQLPFHPGGTVCFDAYGVRKLWRVTGKVEGKERVTLPLGEFDAWHLSGMAVRLDDPKHRREIHAWISDDARRLPLAVMGVIDLGTIRATLTEVARPGEKRRRAEGQESLKW
jgi:Protein of unknown function (DUF3108)